MSSERSQFTELEQSIMRKFAPTSELNIGSPRELKIGRPGYVTYADCRIGADGPDGPALGYYQVGKFAYDDGGIRYNIKMPSVFGKNVGSFEDVILALSGSDARAEELVKEYHMSLSKSDLVGESLAIERICA